MPKRKTRMDALGNASKSYLVFRDVGTSTSGKTRRVLIENTSDEILGGIEWRAGWRRYIFVPRAGALVFDAACLHEIGNELSDMMADHKAKK